MVVSDGQIRILFIGEFTDVSPPQALIKKLQAFLQYAVDLGKLNPDYDLYGERQLEMTTSPGDKLYDILQNPPFEQHFKHQENIR